MSFARNTVSTAYKTSLSTSFPLLLAYFFTIARNLYLTCTRVSFKIALFTYFKRISYKRVHTRCTYRNARGRITFDIKETKSRKEKLSLLFHFPSSSKNSPLCTEIQNFSYGHRARFNVLYTFACCYLLLLEFLMKITHCTLHHHFTREFERERVRHPETSFFLSTIAHAISARCDQNI